MEKIKFRKVLWLVVIVGEYIFFSVILALIGNNTWLSVVAPIAIFSTILFFLWRKLLKNKYCMHYFIFKFLLSFITFLIIASSVFFLVKFCFGL